MCALGPELSTITLEVIPSAKDSSCLGTNEYNGRVTAFVVCKHKDRRTVCAMLSVRYPARDSRLRQTAVKGNAKKRGL